MVKLRESASTHIDAPKEQVLELLGDPDTLSLVGPHGATVTPRGDDEVEIRGTVEGVDVDTRCRVKVEGDHRVDLEPIVTKSGSIGSWYVAEDEGDGTRLVHGRWVEPGNILEEARARLQWRGIHDDLEEELDRVESLVDAVDTASL